MAYTRSTALRRWWGERRAAIKTLERAHAHVGGVNGPGAARRVGRPAAGAHVIVVMSEFQGFVRDLHDLAVAALVTNTVKDHVAGLITNGLTADRALDRGNATLDTVKKDFARLGLTPLDLSVHDPSWSDDVKVLEEMNTLRNAIAHSQAKRLEDLPKAGISESVAATRRRLVSINRAADALDRSVWDHLEGQIGRSPW